MGITARNSYVLTRSYRSTHEIIDVALDTIRDSQSLLADLKNAGDSLVEPETGEVEPRHGPLPVLFAFESPEKEHAGLANEILSLIRRGHLPKEIVKVVLSGCVESFGLDSQRFNYGRPPVCHGWIDSLVEQHSPSE